VCEILVIQTAAYCTKAVEIHSFLNCIRYELRNECGIYVL